MNPTASIREVAAAARVSVGTVSNVLNRPAVVAPATRDRVLAAIESLGFVRNESARQLRSGTARTIGLVVLDVGNPFFTDVARGVEDVATEAGHVVILCNSDESSARESRYLDLLIEQRAHAVLITPVGDSLEPVRRLQQRGVSVVLLDHPTASEEVCSVSVDDVVGGDLATTHLLAGGHQNLVMVTGPESIRQCADRLAGARVAVERTGRPEDALRTVEVPALNVASGQRAAEQLLAAPTLPDGVFCANDLLALGLLQVLMRAGVRIPEDVALVGYDDIDFASAAAVPLTSVRQPRYLIGRTAADLVISETLVPKEHTHQHTVFTPELVVRDSSHPRRSRG
ncbi:LacI family DNA-binding transcriptional regulator [Actinoalloteichus hymeniacidonis]|uniref:Transcriptional regulator, LacI family n=1 Tax=Actinoalloteichus hymeniacidonis TaxID=340345 RepID=A0AAC9HU45_9PSEU|nr:substrate-binding domain-containing protein [Actinoalloteichus hymeniacidonis]AOS64941.1 transcriptional regulator, LacI family [Actinoalloteichus hymeniacidonis]MBB5906984.1 LacI family transcriptional regulator [Actinoalloteichus hymeniacidonis]